MDSANKPWKVASAPIPLGSAVDLDGSIKADEICARIEHSYALVVDRR